MSTLHLLLGFLQFLIAILLSFSFRSNKYVNASLIIVILYGSFNSFSYALLDVPSLTSADNGINFFKLLTLLMIPSGYIYLRQLINKRKNFTYQDLYHLLFPFCWSLIIMLIENQEYLDKDVWILIRKLILACFVSLYVLLPAHLIITSFNSNSLDAKKAIHNSAIKKWSYIFFIATSLILTRGLLNFLLDLDILDNFGLLVSEILKFIFWTVILFKVLTTPEILFGYKKLRNTVNQDPEIHAEQGLTKKGDNYYINNKTIDAYFEGKSLECVLTL